ncbi:MAG: hypothetical protein AVDCRST_MAG17-235, partial [uncultured Solirubrobacterales bacterium]
AANRGRGRARALPPRPGARPRLEAPAGQGRPLQDPDLHRRRPLRVGSDGAYRGGTPQPPRASAV